MKGLSANCWTEAWQYLSGDAVQEAFPARAEHRDTPLAVAILLETMWD